MRARRRTSSNESKPPHRTATLLIDTVLELLDEFHMDEVSLAMVLERSGVSHGSLYHHFDDFHDLVEKAVAQRFQAGLNDSLAGVASLLESADAAEFRRRAEALIVMLSTPERRPYRMYRAEVVGALRGRPRLAAAIARSQQEVIEKQAEYYAEFQQRGWFRPDFDPAALSTFVTAVFLGRTVDDITEQPVDPELYNAITLQALRSVMFPD
jgi:AcrR family transcriptional regulator